MVFALVAVGTSRTFDLILVMTPGSVRDEASVLALRIWQTSGGTTTGDGAALGVVWLVAVVGGIMVAALFVRQAWPHRPLRRHRSPVRSRHPAGDPAARGGCRGRVAGATGGAGRHLGTRPGGRRRTRLVVGTSGWRVLP
ncbi:hypothetical protein NKG94_13070 [Micromonospora sp. M12]